MHMHAYVYMHVAFRDIMMQFQNPTPQPPHTAERGPTQFSPPPSLPPGALRQRAEWSRAVCSDSDIHRMQ